MTEPTFRRAILFQENWQQAYWGSNYARLASVKKKYDPPGLFFVHNGARTGL